MTSASTSQHSSSELSSYFPETASRQAPANETPADKTPAYVTRADQTNAADQTRQVVVVYPSHPQTSEHVMRVYRKPLLSHFKNFRFLFVHEELEVAGVQRTDFIVTKLRTAFKVILLFAPHYDDCKYFRYALQMLIPQHIEKVIPVTLSGCELPVIVQHVAHLRSEDTKFWAKLSGALNAQPPGELKPWKPKNFNLTSSTLNAL